MAPSGPLLVPSSVVATAPEEALAMLDLRISLGLRAEEDEEDEEWPELSNPCAAWRGVRCEEGHVVEVMLSGLRPARAPHQQLSMDALQQLPLLRALNASGFSGSLPAWLGGLVALEVVDFEAASLTGSIPSSLGNLGNLRVLRLANNSLTGAIPSTMGNLKRLALLDLSSNELDGRIPESLGSLGELKELNLSLNRLQGTVPRRLAALGGL